MATAYDIIIRPIITERAMSGAADKKYGAYSSKVAPDSLLFTADGRHIDSWGGIKKTLQ